MLSRARLFYCPVWPAGASLTDSSFRWIRVTGQWELISATTQFARTRSLLSASERRRPLPPVSVGPIILRVYLGRAGIGSSERRGRRRGLIALRLTAGLAARIVKVMEVLLTPDQEAFVRLAIESGRLAREEDAVREALSLWEERERTRAEILAAVDEAEASLARGEGRVITRESMRELAADVKRRGLARLASEQQTPR